MAKKWIKNAIKHPGRLHEHLGVPQGEKIPQAKLQAAMHSQSPTVRREAALAHTLSGFHHKKKTPMTGKHVMGALYGSKG